ncbi:PD-(D/E)XK nuclease family protein [Prevotella sp. KH2C16]|uniref:PD-(D/E)XK nuclease family protein n=1 Tax=Prevotella sp. KH2C16 TaxID=1855325 RepID=UPI0008E7736F|nr:PD-(D/E)XK nuclease family protein [Prevotella sp. KH2C16]SFG12551.1 PD-(D/E)XK nuclease superfamily protein [Prevotella sp. KH2C16]
MKKGFLKYVAEDILNKFGTNLADIVVVFPNKRAALFINEHLARIADKPLWSPAYITISDLFRQQTTVEVGDSIKLICDLYKSFIECTGADETLDHFYGWGQLLLSDFDDIDKNMADADKVFGNLKDIHELDDISFLTEAQKEVLKRFFHNFTDNHQTEIKKRFLALWSHLGNIYHDYNERLSAQGLAYEGALYRSVLVNENTDFRHDKYLFVGFNVLQRVERELFLRLKREGKALFYWDFDDYYMRDNEAGHYVSQYLQDFPNELDSTDGNIYANFVKPKEISYISATTENIQARYIARWLRENNRIAAGKNTAIVMCDESLLPTVIHCLPPEADKVNITTGSPLSQSPFAALVSLLFKLQTIGHPAGTEKFRLRQVSQVLSHPYARYISEKCPSLLNELQNKKIYYPVRERLCIDDGLTLLFSNIETGDRNFNINLLQWMLSILKRIGINARSESDPLFQESLFRMYTLLNRLYELTQNGDLSVDLITLERLIHQLIQSTSIPFHGEPAVGIQIMGVLETRNLDFDHVLVLSCNEGNMPKGVSDSSFIPYSIRKAFGLTTIDNKVAIYAYYFHSLLQRATDITLMYNNATEEGHTGEMSRFMLQLMVESPHKIKRLSIQPGQIASVKYPTAVDKGNEFIQGRLKAMEEISPTALNRYIRCQLNFYYNIILGIKEPDVDDEDMMDNRTFGNIFHYSAELIYQALKEGHPVIRASDLQELLKHPETIERIVDKAFKREVFKIESDSFRPEYNGIQLINRSVIIRYLRQLLSIDEQLTPFEIKGLELPIREEIWFPTAEGNRSIYVKGNIDRLDQIAANGGVRIRVVDYKTGNIPSMKTNNIEDIFAGTNLLKNHSNYHLQTMLYSLLVYDNEELNPTHLPVAPSLLYIQHTQGENADPTLSLGKNRIENIAEYKDEFMAKLKLLLSEIFNPTTAFVPTDDRDRCKNCPYHQLCWM